MSEKKPETVVTSVLLVRHAESEANAGAYFGSQSDSKLSQRGREQVEALRLAMHGVHLDAIYSSDLSRSYDTVAPLASMRGLTVTTTPRLRERAMGVLTGLTFEEAKARYPELWREIAARSPYASPPGGESHAALYDRVATLLDELLAQHAGKTILVGSHGVAINHMLRHLMGIRDHGMTLWFAVDNASVSRIDLHQRGEAVAPRLTYANRVAPIEGHHVTF